MSNVNRSELGSADNVIPSGGRCSSNGSKKKKYAARGNTKREKEKSNAGNKKMATPRETTIANIKQRSLIYDSIDDVF